MEQQYAIFVAYATLQAYEQLQHLLSKWRTEVTPDILTDAAKFGHQKAVERMFPGSVRLPFERGPLQDILASLKLQYDPATANTAAVINMAEESSRRTAQNEQPVTRLTENMRTPISGQYRIPGSSRVEGMADTRRSSHDGVEKLPMPDESSRHRRQSSSDRFSKLNTPRPGENQGESTTRIQPTKLRAITAPVFPWERKKE